MPNWVLQYVHVQAVGPTKLGGKVVQHGSKLMRFDTIDYAVDKLVSGNVQPKENTRCLLYNRFCTCPVSGSSRLTHLAYAIQYLSSHEELHVFLRKKLKLEGRTLREDELNVIGRPA